MSLRFSIVFVGTLRGVNLKGVDKLLSKSLNVRSLLVLTALLQICELSTEDFHRSLLNELRHDLNGGRGCRRD
jgi:hypothetical protein